MGWRNFGGGRGWTSDDPQRGILEERRVVPKMKGRGFRPVLREMGVEIEGSRGSGILGRR